VPLGLAVLAVVEVLRWDQRQSGEVGHIPELVALEIAGFAFRSAPFPSG
jgi:hypothetical protein